MCCLLDNGSTNNFITQDLCGKLNHNPISNETKVFDINNKTLSSLQSCSLTLESYVSGYRIGVDCITLPRITLLSTTNINFNDIKIPSGLHLGDPSFHILSYSRQFKRCRNILVRDWNKLYELRLK